jgi:hypothetical protein
MGIERDVKKKGAAARRQRFGAGGKTLPMRPPRFIEMHMRVNHSGKNVQACCVNHLSTFFLQGRLQSDDLPIRQADIECLQTVARHDLAADNTEVQLRDAF